MKYLSVCSGVEAASLAWEPLGFNPVAFSEIEPFPSAVLAHRWPEVPNLGDMTKYENWNLPEDIDLLVGGTPCQSFSIAGLRKGLDDDRGNLMLTFLRIADKFKPSWVVWENVPGVLSDKKGAFGVFLDALSELDFIPSVDILDAQCFGVPQRRKRVFVVAQSKEDLLRKKSPSSALTIAQCLIETLHEFCAVNCTKFAKKRTSSALAKSAKVGLRKKMRFFKNVEDECLLPKLLNCLEDAAVNFLLDGERSEGASGESAREHTPEDLSTALEKEALSLLIDGSWKNTLAEALAVVKSYTTSTSTNSTTTYQTYICSQAVAAIGVLILLLRKSSPNSLGAGLSFSTAIQDFTNYARTASNQSLTEMGRVFDWSDFFRQTEHFYKFVGCLGDSTRAARVLFERESLQRNPPPSREAREDVTPFTPGSFGGYREGVGTLKASGGDLAGGSETLAVIGNIDQELNANADISGPLLRKGSGGFEGVVATHRLVSFGEYASDDTASPVLARDHKGATDLVTHVASVRKLTPVECERLQGFPDNHTRIPWKNKPEEQCPKGHRYKACGNSMAVPVMRWIGERIKLHS